jgi:citrate synthase
MPMIAAVAYRTAMGLPVVYPRREFSYTKNFLYMMFKDPTTDQFDINDFLVSSLDKILILHADHEQNASTSTVRIAGSSLANPYACIAAGIASLWGPMHGGANEACLEMLNKIGKPENIDEFFHNVITTRSERLMGFGHRVYKNMDPRTETIKEIAHEIMTNESLNLQNKHLLELAKLVEERALSEPFFIQRKLYPNVDYYSGIVLQGIGIPVQMFTVIFALARSIGWISQWAEMMGEKTHKIQRPRQLYVGEAKRDFVPISSRQREKSLIEGE